MLFRSAFRHIDLDACLMTIWVDADACPGAIKEILYRAAQRASIQLKLVANRALQVPRSPWINMIQVPRGFVGQHDAARGRAC